ncbi:MAG: ATP-binding cassette domain-containing protein [Anaerolineae bacterium]|nr:ATP-binding cassette domain-containing protein [Anaerolineae bacterium]
MIHAEQLAKRFKKFQALTDITFDAHDGQVFGLLGPNGAGKTTTLRLLSTVLEPDRGTATVSGHDIRRHKQQVRKNLGILVENAGLYKQLTARECLRYVGKLHGMDGPPLEQQIERLANELAMESFLDRKTDGFSRGMTRKVVMGMALIHNPPNVIFDEPTAGLDVVSTRAVRDLIHRFKQEGRCVILSTHLMDEVERLCDRIAIIHRGAIMATGTPDELKRAQGVDDLESAFVKIVGEQALMDEALREAEIEKRK